MEIIPAIDIIGGRCVRLTKGDYNSVKEYASDPLQVARTFEESGIKRLHLVDLDGAKSKTVVNLPVLRSITENTSLQVDFGGGVKRRADLEKVLEAGATQVTAGSIAAKEPETVKSWLKEFGSEKIILGADVLNEQIRISGWQEDGGVGIFEFLTSYVEAGAQYVICTDISKDGVLQGPSHELYANILERFPDLRLIASGGVTSLEDLHLLRENGLHGAIIGKAYYEGRITLKELTELC